MAMGTLGSYGMQGEIKYKHLTKVNLTILRKCVVMVETVTDQWMHLVLISDTIVTE